MLIPAGFVQANVIYVGTSVPQGAEWTLGLDLAGFAGSLTDVATTLINAFVTTDMTAHFTADATISGVLIKEGPNATGPSVLVPFNVGGTNEGATVTPQVSILLQKETASGGRQGRGRAYLPGMAEADVEASGQLASSFLTAMNANADLFFAKLGTDLLDPVLLHAETSPITTPTPLTGLSVDSRVATQRRRLRG